MPQIPEINPSMANTQSLGQVRIDSPLVRDERYAAKAKKYEKISNILELEGREYQQKWERKQAVQRQLTASQEQMNASVLGDDLLRKASELPDDEVLPFIQKGMEDYNSQAYKKYGGDQEMWGQVSLNIQKAALETQHKAFNFVQERAKDTALASFVEQEMYLKSKALNSKDPNIELAQLDASLDSLVKAGYMTKTQAAKSSIDSRGDIMVGRISQMITKDNFRAAAQTLEANRGMLPLNAQIQLENSIRSGSERIVNHNRKLEEKRIADKIAFDELSIIDPAEAYYKMGVDPKDKKAVAAATGNRAVFSNKEIKKINTILNSAKNGTEFINTYNQIKQSVVGQDPSLAEIFDKQMEEGISSDVAFMKELQENGADEQINLLFEAKKAKKEDVNKLAKLEDIQADIDREASTRLSWMRRNRSADEVTAYYKNVSKIAQMHMIQRGASQSDAVKFAVSGTADNFKSVRVNGAEVPIVGDSAPSNVVEGLKEFAKQNIGVGSNYVRFDLSPDKKSYLVINPETSAALSKDGKPLVITPDQAQILGATKLKGESIKKMDSMIKELNKELAPKEKRKAAPINITD